MEGAGKHVGITLTTWKDIVALWMHRPAIRRALMQQSQSLALNLKMLHQYRKPEFLLPKLFSLHKQRLERNRKLSLPTQVNSVSLRLLQ